MHRDNGEEMILARIYKWAEMITAEEGPTTLREASRTLRAKVALRASKAARLAAACQEREHDMVVSLHSHREPLDRDTSIWELPT